MSAAPTAPPTVGEHAPRESGLESGSGPESGVADLAHRAGEALVALRQSASRIGSFGVVGVGVFVLMQAALYVLVDLAYWNPTVAATVLVGLSIWLNYELNRRWTWRDRGDARAGLFLLTRVVTAGLGVVLFAALHRLGVNYLLANTVAVLAQMATNFVVSDRIVFTASVSSASASTTAGPGRPASRRVGAHTSAPGLGWGAGLLCLGVAASVVLLVRLFTPGLFLPMVMVVLSVLAASVAALYLTSLLYAHRHGWSATSLRLPPRQAPGPATERVAVLMPARKETEVLGETVLNAAWTQRDHDNHRLYSIICDDDHATLRVALAAGRTVNDALGDDGRLPADADLDVLRTTYHDALAGTDRESPLTGTELALLSQWAQDDALFQLVVFPLQGRKPAKPKQLNYAFGLLKDSGATVFTILDAESKAQPGLLTHVDRVLAEHPDAGVVQGAVQLMDPALTGSRLQRTRQYLTRWYSWHNLLEYYRWFGGQLAFQADSDFVPLGGNTVFIRRELLELTKGWPETLTEDCALGVKLSARHGARVYTFYEPRLATQEETPPTAGDLRRQRTRWTQGFLQSFVEGEWRLLPTARQRLLALWILASPLVQAVAAPLLPLTLVIMVLGAVKSPPVLVLLMFVPLLAMVLITLLQLKQLHEYAVHYDRRIGWYTYVWVVLTQLPYQWLLSYSALLAVLRHSTNRTDWQSPARAGDLLPRPLPQLAGAVE